MRPCLTPGCPELVPKGRCRQHAAERERQRGTPAERRYDASWYARVRAAIAEEPWCHCVLAHWWHGAVCLSLRDLTGDHPVALAAGGSPEQEPVPMCRRCNSGKRDRAA